MEELTFEVADSARDDGKARLTKDISGVIENWCLGAKSSYGAISSWCKAQRLRAAVFVSGIDQKHQLDVKSSLGHIGEVLDGEKLSNLEESGVLC